MESINKGNSMTKQDVMSLLVKSADGEHGAYVLQLFEDAFGDETPDTNFEKEEMDSFLKLAIELASIKTRLNASRNDPKQNHYKCYGLRYVKQS